MIYAVYEIRSSGSSRRLRYFTTAEAAERYRASRQSVNLKLHEVHPVELERVVELLNESLVT